VNRSHDEPYPIRRERANGKSLGMGLGRNLWSGLGSGLQTLRTGTG
jgi:hypothetical protein